MAIKNISYNTGFVSLDNVCYFPPYDDDKPTFCAELPITSTEYANAGMLGIRATVSLLIDTESDDTAETAVRYNGKIYVIYRRYAMASGYTQLYCNERAGAF